MMSFTLDFIVIMTSTLLSHIVSDSHLCSSSLLLFQTIFWRWLANVCVSLEKLTQTRCGMLVYSSLQFLKYWGTQVLTEMMFEWKNDARRLNQETLCNNFLQLEAWFACFIFPLKLFSSFFLVLSADILASSWLSVYQDHHENNDRCRMVFDVKMTLGSSLRKTRVDQETQATLRFTGRKSSDTHETNLM
jgi:hypothetical protein